MAYRLSQKADDDLVEIYIDGVREWGVSQAEKYHAELKHVFEILSGNPELARERAEITPPVRIHPHGSHVIVYVIDDHRDVFVIRVRSSREDWVSDPI
ncbi:type II toxin-antitoxin system RelE/ParE family toxin [Pelagibius sp. Alg239-R121]|uniref:type II toxin-antitoxin system RelE/ParE family toxin n=1 Tax=Pelagibius sp. Alg239-R121 TaxID=2993448 RepID=UPI0024A6D87C|nr:type II toxin-antitoxin system RelE/ParE family toxin [Pelagibius sp. Alg239-R121]